MIGGARIADWIRRRRAVHIRFNPYIVGAPVFDRRLFFGRQTLARRAVELLSSRSLRLEGERRIGKTSFLHQLSGELACDGGAYRSYPVFVDLETVRVSDVLHALMEETLEALVLPASIRLELRFSPGKSGYHDADFSRDIARLLEVLDGREQRRARLVFLIDEIDALRDSRTHAGAWLGSVLSTGSEQLRTVLAGAGSSVSALEATHACIAGLAALSLPPLAPRDAEALVREPVAGVYTYTNPAVERILEASRLRPFAIQRLCRRAVDRMLDDARSTVSVSDVEPIPA